MKTPFLQCKIGKMTSYSLAAKKPSTKILSHNLVQTCPIRVSFLAVWQPNKQQHNITSNRSEARLRLNGDWELAQRLFDGLSVIRGAKCLDRVMEELHTQSVRHTEEMSETIGTVVLIWCIFIVDTYGRTWRMQALQHRCAWDIVSTCLRSKSGHVSWVTYWVCFGTKHSLAQNDSSGTPVRINRT